MSRRSPESAAGRPWRLAVPPPGAPAAGGDEFGALARELENEGYRRWLAHREAAPPGWRDEAFSTVLHLAPAELADVAARIRGIIAAYAGREAGGPGVLPVAVVARMFPLLPAGAQEPGDPQEPGQPGGPAA